MPRGDKDGSTIHVPTSNGQREHWIIRRRYTVKGKLKEKKRKAFSVTEATRLARKIDLEIAAELAGEPVTDSRRTFDDLVTFARKRVLKPAEYSGDTKIAGLRSLRAVEGHLKPLQEWFGKMVVSEITYDDIHEYKLARLKKPIVIKVDDETTITRQRSIASVNRELALARRLFFMAMRKPLQWISHHPFHGDRPLIQTADEIKRMRILSNAEEERLLEACTGKRSHLRPQIIFAIETGMRQNEQLTLKLSDIDFTDCIITVRAFNSKTGKTRVVPIFDRLARELQASLITRRNAKPDDLLFIDGCPRHAFENARDAAGIHGLRWHDLRHTAATRMLHTYGLQAAEVMKILGHDNLKTFLRYVNIDREIATSIRQRVNAARAAAAEAARTSTHETKETESIDLGDVTELSQ